jgi:hypothetical protein
MVARSADGICRTQPLESHAQPPIATEDGPDWSGFENWMEGHKALLRDEFCRNTGEALGRIAAGIDRTIAAQAKRITELELKLAAAVGAIDILRGKGAPGALRVRGTHNDTELYLANDIVALNGSSFVALKDRPGDCPGDGWQLLASAGKRGPRGERGPIGPRGAEAPRWRSVMYDAGKNAFVVRLSDGSIGAVISVDCVFAGIDVDPMTYSVVLKMLDGSELKFSLRALFAQFFDEVKGR